MYQRIIALCALGLIAAACGALPQAAPISLDAATPVIPAAAPAATTDPASMAEPTMPQAVPPTAVPAPSGPPAPDFIGGGAWLNSEPLTLAELRGRVVLVEFWTYGCYNCQNVQPYLRQWWDSYRDQGLVIVGVHTPEFASERELANVRAAAERQGVTWPIVQDNDRAIWRAYGNRYWPRLYLIDHTGAIIYDHIGEGAYQETERQIQNALAAAAR